jgi:hypothetical protein
MTKLTKLLLGLAVAGIGSGLLFVTGLINVQDSVFWYVTLPAGAIFLGLFLISLFLEKEVAHFDKQEQLAYARANKSRSDCSSEGASCACAEKSAALVSAH